jgi:CheY-like chemotaxis protein
MITSKAIAAPVTSIEPNTELLSPAEPAEPKSDGVTDDDSRVPQFIPVPASVPSQAGAKRVLLLEDDPAFREVIKDFFSETGYTVKEAKSGIEGIQEVLAGDFAVVLCDMMMPGLPGDLFYRAVERARPSLCERFIFMTGHRGNTTANDFIKAVKGSVLLKPFSLDSLLRAICEMERRRQVAQQTVLEKTREHQERVSGPLLRALPDPIPAIVVPNLPAVQIPNRPARHYAVEDSTLRDDQRRQRIRTIIAVALAVTVVFYCWYGVAEDRNAAASNELRTLEARWKAVEVDLNDARKMGERFEKISNHAVQMANEYKGHYWSTALQRIIASTPEQIQMRDIRIGRDGTSAAWSLFIAARCTGDRLETDAYRRKIEQELKKIFAGAVTTRFDEMEDIPPDTNGPASRAAVDFAMVATIDITGKPIP